MVHVSRRSTLPELPLSEWDGETLLSTWGKKDTFMQVRGADRSGAPSLSSERVDVSIYEYLRSRSILPADEFVWGDERNWPGYVFRYYFLVPDAKLDLIEQFALLHEKSTVKFGDLTILTGYATFNDAQEMGGRQRVLQLTDFREEDIFWYQKVAGELYDKSSIPLHSQMPTDLDPMPFDEGILYQTNDREASRGVLWDMHNLQQRHSLT